MGNNGKPNLHAPIVTSPLGAPASYPPVALTDQTRPAMQQLLASKLPRMKPLGLNRATGEMVLLTTHSTADRILDEAMYRACMDRIRENGFSTVMTLDGQ